MNSQEIRALNQDMLSRASKESVRGAFLQVLLAQLQKIHSRGPLASAIPFLNQWVMVVQNASNQRPGPSSVWCQPLNLDRAGIPTTLAASILTRSALKDTVEFHEAVKETCASKAQHASPA